MRLQLKPLPAFVVFLSGYWPLGLIVAALDFDWTGFQLRTPWTVGAMIAGFIAACIFTAWHFSHYQKGDRVVLKQVKDRSVELLNYAVPYIAGFAGVETGNLGHIAAMLLVLWVVFYVTYKTHTVVVNPFLLSLGYRLYDLQFDWNDGSRGEALAVSRYPLSPQSIVRIQNISTSCVLVVAVISSPENST